MAYKNLNPKKIVVTVPWQTWSFLSALQNLLGLNQHEFVSCAINGDLWNDDACVARIRCGRYGEDVFKCGVGMVEDDTLGDYVGISNVIDARMRFRTKEEAQSWVGDIESVAGSLCWKYDEKKALLRFSVQSEQTEKLYHGKFQIAEIRKARLASGK